MPNHDSDPPELHVLPESTNVVPYTSPTPNLPPGALVNFRIVLFIVCGLCVLSLAASFVLALYIPTPSDQVKQLIDTCDTTWKLGAGVLFGLLGRKGM